MFCWRGVCRLCRGRAGALEDADGEPPLHSLSCAEEPLRGDHGEELPPDDAVEDTVGRVSISPTLGRKRSVPLRVGDELPLVRAKTVGNKIQDHYALNWSTLGKGTYSTVRTATSTETGLLRAVKMILKRNMSKGPNFQNEIELTKAMDHPNIIKLYETFEDHRNFYLVMELCSGGELLDRIVEVGRLTEPQAAAVMQQICQTICYMHEQRICHRDLKPENFIFAAKGPIESTPLKLIDFGLSRRFEPGEVLTTSVGTVLYVAPEVLSGAYGSACDLWSFGVITYCLLCGSPPFDGQTPKQVGKCIRRAKFSFDGPCWGAVSGDAKTLIERLLRKDPEERLTAAQVLEDRWIKHRAPGSSGEDLGPDLVDNIRIFHQANRRARSLQKRARSRSCSV